MKNEDEKKVYFLALKTFWLWILQESEQPERPAQADLLGFLGVTEKKNRL